MRNPIFIEAYARKMCDFNYNQKLRDTVARYIPKE
jgi:uncharacterized protein (DUF2164 family)